MSWAAMILPKNSLLTAMFREDILWLHERGIMQDPMLKWKGGVIGANNDFEKKYSCLWVKQHQSTLSWL